MGMSQMRTGTLVCEEEEDITNGDVPDEDDRDC
jgi:hypothetical protein